MSTVALCGDSVLSEGLSVLGGSSLGGEKVEKVDYKLTTKLSFFPQILQNQQSYKPGIASLLCLTQFSVWKLR